MRVDWYATAFELIDLRSFSNLWFWIMLAVFWSTASHFVLGVPFDMVTRAARQGGQADRDLLDLVRINADRLIYISDVAGSWLVAIGFFLFSSLVLMGFAYKVEFCQALTLILTPMALVFLMSVRRARNIVGLSPEETRRRLRNHRLLIQIIGVLSILVTSMWGMFYNLSVGVLGG